MIPSPPLTAAPRAVPARDPGLRDRWRERRRLIEQDRRAAERAERYFLASLLADARDRVHAGWVQNCWFVINDEHGRPRRIGAPNLDELQGSPVTAVCLVGAIVQAAGGIERAGTQPVHQAIDLTWATLYDQPLRRWASAPVRLSYIHDLTGWNDAPRRTAEDVAGLLTAASRQALQ
jgi:hypothetical protein